MRETHPKMTKVVPLTKAQILAMSAKILPGQTLTRMTVISANHLSDPGSFECDIYGSVGISGSDGTIVLDAKRPGVEEGSSLTAGFVGKMTHGTFIVTFEGITFDKMQMRFESSGGSETIDVPKGVFHIPVLMVVGDEGYFKITPLITDGRGVYIRLDSIQIHRAN